MITEHALLPVASGREGEFEQAFESAQHLIAASPGFLDLALLRGIESQSTYLLLVHWESVNDHEVGFRRSPAYDEWRALLHHFYDPFPTVEHYVEIAAA
jgi:heme-degrading monooxygenase HmoA